MNSVLLDFNFLNFSSITLLTKRRDPRDGCCEWLWSIATLSNGSLLYLNHIWTKLDKITHLRKRQLPIIIEDKILLNKLYIRGIFIIIILILL